MMFSIPYPLSRKHPRLSNDDILFLKRKQAELALTYDTLESINIAAFTALLHSKGLE